jgi:carbonic anhydrase
MGWSRRCVFLLALLPVAALPPASAAAQPQSAGLALGRLKAGNERFAAGASAPLAAGASTRRAAAARHAPLAMILSCADARVPPEIVFDARLGELFVVRTLGSVADQAVIASLEYGTTRLHAPLLVVMGHEACDIVGDALAPEADQDSVLIAALRRAPERTVEERADVRAAVLAAVEQVINDVIAGSEALRQAVRAGHLQVVGAYYEAAGGRVMFSAPVTAVPAEDTP